MPGSNYRRGNGWKCFPEKGTEVERRNGNGGGSVKYLGKKTITLIMTLFLVSVAAFLAFQIIPGDVVMSILGTEATPEREEQLREELGFNDPPAVRDRKSVV